MSCEQWVMIKVVKYSSWPMDQSSLLFKYLKFFPIFVNLKIH